MRKMLILLTIIIMIFGMTSIYKYNSRYTKSMEDIQLETFNKIEYLSGEIQLLKENLKAYKEYYEEEYELRNVLDIKFYDLMNDLRNEDEDSIRDIFVKDIEYLDNSIKYVYQGEIFEYTFNPQDIFRQRFFHYNKEENIFEAGYELLNTELNDLVYVTYLKIANQWKIVFIKKDIG